MFKHECNICQESYSRKWNLKRHIHDVHGIEIDNTHNSNSEIEKYPNHSYSNSKILPKNDIEYNIYNQNSYWRNNYPGNFDYSMYHYNEYFPSFSWDPPNKQKERLTQDEKIKIQRILRKLAIQLYNRGYTPYYANKTAKLLNYRCNIEASDEPLKRFLTSCGLGDLWEY